MSVAVPILQKRIKKWLGSMYSSDAHSDSDIIDYINSAIRHLATDALFPFLVFTHTFKAKWDRTKYPIPTNFSVRCLKRWNTRLTYWCDWEETYRGCKDTCWCSRILISHEYIELVDSKDTNEYSIIYRWLPKRIDYAIEWNHYTESYVDVPEVLEDAIVHLWLYYWFLDIKEVDSATERLNLYSIELRRLKSMYSDVVETQQERLSSGHRF